MRTSLVMMVAVLLCAVSSVRGSFLLGIEGTCTELCADLALDLVHAPLPNPSNPSHLFNVVGTRSDKTQMSLARFDSYDPTSQVYYLVTRLNPQPLQYFYQLFVADIKTYTTVNVTLRLWNTAWLSSIQWDQSTSQLFAVVDNCMMTIDTTTGKLSYYGTIFNSTVYAQYQPLFMQTFDPTSRNYFFSVLDTVNNLYALAVFNLNDQSVIITPPVTTDPIKDPYPLEIMFVPVKSLVYVLVNSNMGGGIQSINWVTGEWKNVVNPGSFIPDTYDIDPAALEGAKNQESAYDPINNWWYLCLIDTGTLETIIVPWDVQGNKFAKGAYSVSDDMSNWQFMSS